MTSARLSRLFLLSLEIWYAFYASSGVLVLVLVMPRGLLVDPLCAMQTNVYKRLRALQTQLLELSGTQMPNSSDPYQICKLYLMLAISARLTRCGQIYFAVRW